MPFSLSGMKSGLVEFETEELKGRLLCNGSQHGICSLARKERPIEAANPDWCLFNLYRWLSRDRYHGMPRQTPFSWEASAQQICLRWEPYPEHQATTIATYRLYEPNAVELDIRVVPHAAYLEYELFLSGYLTSGWVPEVIIKPTMHAQDSFPSALIPQANEFLRGCYLYYPQHQAGVRRLFDGRWQRGGYPTHWATGRFFARALVNYRHLSSGQCCLALAKQADCFAIGSSYVTDDPQDSVAAHRAMYFSLFGQDTLPGFPLITRLRLYLLASSDEKMRERLYADFQAQEWRG